MEYNEKIEQISKEVLHLDYYPQEFEVVSFEDMLCYEAYVGMPSHYSHWSYGKTYDRLKTEYKYNLSGLPYEMVINSDPCIAYLMKDNTLLLQIMTIAHVYGHNDFFKNNRLFKEYTNAKLTVEKFKNHADRVKSYIHDPSIGYEAVERIIDAAHSIKYQCNSFRKTAFEEGQKPEFPCDNLLQFLSEYGRLEDWERDVLQIVMEESIYFYPQIETKIINEGWATFCHYNTMNRLGLGPDLMFEFYKVHNAVVCQHPGSLNPYHLGYQIWKDLYEKNDHDFTKLLHIREQERDSSFIRKYLTLDIALESNLVQFQEEDRYYIVSDVADSEGYKNIRNTLASQVGMGGIPIVEVVDVLEADNTLVLQHVNDGRELNLSYATETIKYIQTLWGGRVVLYTTLSNIPRKIICSTSKKVSIENDK